MAKVLNYFTSEYLDTNSKKDVIKIIQYLADSEPYLSKGECEALKIAIECINKCIELEEDDGK